MRETKLLIADSDSTVREIIRLGAFNEGWECDDVQDGILALKYLRKNEYHLVILDADLPEVGGLVVCRHLRKSSAVPVIILGRNGNEDDRLAGFEAGGNDYVVKPFYPRELIARAKNLLKICGHALNAQKALSAGKLLLDMDSHSVFIDSRPVSLTPKEFDLLLFFCNNPHVAFSRDALLDYVWGQDFFGSDRTVDTHVKGLRAKIQPYQAYIETIWGYGYKFEPGTEG